MASAILARTAVLPAKRLAWFRPEWPWVLLVVAAWIAALVSGGSHLVDHNPVSGGSLDAHAHHEMHGQMGVGEMPGVDHESGHHLGAAGLGWWLVMVVAMMVPATLPMLRVLGLNSMWERRYRAPALFLATYVGIWLAFGVVAIAAWSLIGTGGAGTETGADTATAVALLVAAAWHLTRWHGRFIKRGHLELPLAPRNPAADRSCVRFGAYHARQCVGSCWPIMVAMVPAHGLALMAAATIVTSWERSARKPRREVSAAAIAAIAVMTFTFGV